MKVFEFCSNIEEEGIEGGKDNPVTTEAASASIVVVGASPSSPKLFSDEALQKKVEWGSRERKRERERVEACLLPPTHQRPSSSTRVDDNLWMRVGWEVCKTRRHKDK